MPRKVRLAGAHREPQEQQDSRRKSTLTAHAHMWKYYPKRRSIVLHDAICYNRRQMWTSRGAGPPTNGVRSVMHDRGSLPEFA